MSKELKCPHCGKVFSIDESEYIELLSQGRNQEFDKELASRIHQLEESKQKEKELLQTKLESENKDNVAKLREEIFRLENELKQSKNEKEYAIKDAVSEKEKEILSLRSDIQLKDKENELQLRNLKSQYEDKLKGKEEEVAYYKDLKTKLSTKLVGETLEQHCQIEFNRLRMTAFPNAYFEKDNDASSGSKGDFIYREHDENNIEIPFTQVVVHKPDGE